MILDVKLPSLSERNPHAVVHSICEKHEIDTSKVFSDSRRKRVVYVRHKVVKKLRAMGLTYQKIGDILNRNHSSIIYLDQKYKAFTRN